jgi:hypothetical protein
MKGHFKKGRLPFALSLQGFQENKTYDCYYNQDRNLVVKTDDGAMYIVDRGFVEDTFNISPFVVFKITERT